MSNNKTQKYEYRIVLEYHNGTVLPLLPQGGDLHDTQQRLWDILLNPDYAKGWVERRPLGAWEILPGLQVRQEESAMTNEEKVTALTNAASDAYRTTARFAYLTYVQRLRNRFQQWGDTASDTLLSNLENNGYTIAKIEQGGNDERESSAVVVGAETPEVNIEAQAD